MENPVYLCSDFQKLPDLALLISLAHAMSTMPETYQHVTLDKILFLAVAHHTVKERQQISDRQLTDEMREDWVNFGNVRLDSLGR
jgi:hypothetical protein